MKEDKGRTIGEISKELSKKLEPFQEQMDLIRMEQEKITRKMQKIFEPIRKMQEKLFEPIKEIREQWEERFKELSIITKQWKEQYEEKKGSKALSKALKQQGIIIPEQKIKTFQEQTIELLEEIKKNTEEIKKKL